MAQKLSKKDEPSRTRQAVNDALTALVAPIVLPPYMLYKLGEMGVEGYERIAELLKRNMYRPPDPRRAAEYTELAAEGLVSSVPGGPSVADDAAVGMIKGGTLGRRRATRKKMQTALQHMRKRPPRTWLRRTKPGEMKQVGGQYALADKYEPTISSKVVRGILLHGGDPTHYPKMGETFKNYIPKPYFGEPWGISTTLLPEKVAAFTKRPKKFDRAYSALSKKLYELGYKARQQYPTYRALSKQDKYDDAMTYLFAKDPVLAKRMKGIRGKLDFLSRLRSPFLRVQPMWTDVPERMILDNTTPRGWHAHADAVLEALQEYPRVWERTPTGAKLRSDYYHMIDRDMEWKADLSKKVAKNLQRKGYMGILSNPHRYGEYELRIFPPEKLMAVDRRMYDPRSTVSSRTDPGIRRLSGMLDARLKEYADAKIERPAHMGGPGDYFRTFGPKYGDLKRKATKTGPLAWGYKPWSGLKPQQISPKRLQSTAAQEAEKLKKIVPAEMEDYMKHMTQVEHEMLPEEIDAMKALKEFDPAYQQQMLVDKYASTPYYLDAGTFDVLINAPNQFFSGWLKGLPSPLKVFIEAVAKQYDKGLITKPEAIIDINEQLYDTAKAYVKAHGKEPKWAAGIDVPVKKEWENWDISDQAFKELDDTAADFAKAGKKEVLDFGDLDDDIFYGAAKKSPFTKSPAQKIIESDLLAKAVIEVPTNDLVAFDDAKYVLDQYNNGLLAYDEALKKLNSIKNEAIFKASKLAKSGKGILIGKPIEQIKKEVEPHGLLKNLASSNPDAPNPSTYFGPLTIKQHNQIVDVAKKWAGAEYGVLPTKDAFDAVLSIAGVKK